MKTAKVGSDKIVKAAKTRRVAGVQIRSGVKAGKIGFEPGGKRGLEGESLGGPGGLHEFG